MKSVLYTDEIPTSWDLMYHTELVQKHSEMPGIIKKGPYTDTRLSRRVHSWNKVWKTSKMFKKVFYHVLATKNFQNDEICFIF